MMETKYGNYLATGCVKPNTKEIGAVSSTRHIANFADKDITMDTVIMSKPQVIISQPHKHDFPQYLHFFSANHIDASDFDAEIEIYLGEEQEKHIINEPTVIHVPPGLPHGPVKVTRINKPVLFVDIAVTGTYTRVGNTPD